jgi:hypothetical protein
MTLAFMGAACNNSGGSVFAVSFPGDGSRKSVANLINMPAPYRHTGESRNDGIRGGFMTLCN